LPAHRLPDDREVVVAAFELGCLSADASSADRDGDFARRGETAATDGQGSER
jgi:hypothetical protein